MDSKHPDYGSLTDQELIEAIIGGDGDAVEYLLVTTCGGAFKRMSATYRAARMEPEDLAQEMCLILAKNDWNALSNFKAVNKSTGRSCRLKTYVVHCAARMIKKKCADRVSEIDWSSALSDENGNWIEVGDDKLDSERLKMNVLEAIMALSSPQERLVLLEYKIRGRTPEDVAQMLNTHTKSKGTVENVYTICCRAQKNLRVLLEEGGVYA